MTNLFQSIGHMFQGFSGNTWLGKVAIASGALLTAYFTPIIGLLVACFGCSVVDMCYGIKVAAAQGKKITSKKNWKGTIIKIKDEFLLILLAHLIEYVLFGADATLWLSGGITAIVTLTELWSILENLNTLNPDGPWRMLSKFLKKKGEEYTGIDLDLNENSDSKSNNNEIIADDGSDNDMAAEEL